METALLDHPADTLIRDGAAAQRRVLFIDDVAHRLGCSRKTIERRLQAGTFPIQPLPSIDNRKRWSADDVDAYERGRLRQVLRP